MFPPTVSAGKGRMHLLRAAALAIVLLVCALPFVHRDDAAAEHAAATKQSALRLAMPETSLTVDPALVADEQNVQFSGLLYSGLVRLDTSYHVVKDAASRIQMSKDHR